LYLLVRFHHPPLRVYTGYGSKTRAVGMSLGDGACISVAMKDLAACVYDGRRLAKMQPGS
jgi:PIN domain nuclease of toxin-antitoxin system